MRREKEELTQIMRNSMVNYHIVPRSELTDGENVRYFQEYKKLYSTAYCIDSQLKEFEKMCQQLKGRFDQIDKSFELCQKEERNLKSTKSSSNKPKRYRRTIEMIDRNFKCSFAKCDKTYASEGSLQQHIRLKHQDSPLQYGQCQRQRREKKEKNQLESVSEDEYCKSEENQDEDEDESESTAKKQSIN